MKLRLQPLGSPSALEHRGPVVVIGRDPGCELALCGEDERHRAVSWQHARIELTRGGASLTDLGSSNGTFVNDVRVTRPTALKVRDVIRLGLSGPELEVVEVDLSEARLPGPGRAGAARRPAAVRAPQPETSPRVPPVALPTTLPYPAPSPGPGHDPAGQPLSPTRQLLVALQGRQRTVLLGAGIAALFFLVALGGLWWRQGRLARQAALAQAALAQAAAPAEPATPPAPEPPPAAPDPAPAQKTEPPAVPAPATPAAPAAPAASGPGQQAVAVLTKYCYRCHGENDSKEGGFNYVLDYDKLLARKKVVPGDLGKSKLFKKVKAGEMPPEEVDDPNLRPKAVDVAVLQQWIEAGAPPFPAAPVAAARRFISPKEMLTLIRDHLRLKVRPEDRLFQRYYTLTHLYNNPKVEAEKLPLYRAALSKLVNSLSWGGAMVVPTPVDPEGTIYQVDLRRLGWDGDLWQAVLGAYPYGLTYDLDADEQTRDLAREVEFLSGTRLPYLRADWFIANASQPPLYHTLLYDQILPELCRRPAAAGDPENPKKMTAHDLEAFLGVDLELNFQTNNLVRAGFLKSGVSKNNRLVERHKARYGAYWRSYDFKSNEGHGNLLEFPLGPVFPGNPFAQPPRHDQAFQQAGGEIIFNLPNGLQAYLLIDAKDKRINKGPPDVVSDLGQNSGTTEIVTGLSCMGCHKQGMISDGWKDEIRDSRTVADEALEKVQVLYARKAVMDQLLEQDQVRFQNALDLAIGNFVKGGADKDKDGGVSTEPVVAIAKLHLKGVGPEEAACELGLPDPKVLQEAIRTNATLREKLGLGPLVQGIALKRDAWESLLTDRFSPFQQAAEELRLGKPFRPAAPQRPRRASPFRPPAGGHPSDLPPG